MRTRKLYQTVFSKSFRSDVPNTGKIDLQPGDVVTFIGSDNCYKSREVEEVKGQVAVYGPLKSGTRVLDGGGLINPNEITQIIRPTGEEVEVPDPVKVVEPEVEPEPDPVKEPEPAPPPKVVKKKATKEPKAAEKPIWEDDDEVLGGITPPGSSRPCT